MIKPFDGSAYRSMTLDVLDAQAQAWLVNQRLQAQAKQDALDAESRALDARVVVCAEEILPESLRGKIHLAYRARRTEVYEKAAVIIQTATWRVWVDMERRFSEDTWEIFGFAPMRPEVSEDEDFRHHVDWVRMSRDTTPDLLEAIAAATELHSMLPGVERRVAELNAEQSAAKASEPVYVPVDETGQAAPVGHGLMDELVVLIRDVVREELRA